MTGERNVTYAFEGSMKRILQIFIPVPIQLEIFVPIPKIPIRFLLIQLPYSHLLLRQLSLPFLLIWHKHIGPAVTLFFPRHGWSVRFIRYWDFFPSPYESYSTGDVDAVVVAFELLLEPLPAWFVRRANLRLPDTNLDSDFRSNRILLRHGCYARGYMAPYWRTAARGP